MNEPKKIDAHAWPRDPHDWYVESEACSIALFQATAVSAKSHGRHTRIPGVIRNIAACSIG